LITVMDMLDGSDIPKRGDLLHSNVGNRRERTWIVLRVRTLRRTKSVPRCQIWAERWWQMEVALRVRLYRSAERNGGQRVIYFARYKSKPKKRAPLPWEL
jgi:hypothetical protein